MDNKKDLKSIVIELNLILNHIHEAKKLSAMKEVKKSLRNIQDKLTDML